VNPKLEETTMASAENRDSQGRPLPKLPQLSGFEQMSPARRAWERMLDRSRRNRLATTISSLLRFRRLEFPTPTITALRQPVRQFQGQGFAIQIAGVLAWIALSWKYEFVGLGGGAGVALVCYFYGRSKSKPWRCGNCKAPLATAKVRVCPGCGARLVDLNAVKVLPRKS
jgi:hypothetical protein